MTYVKPGEHPLLPQGGRLVTHRLILFDRIGPGPHPCHWCSKTVEWMVGARTKQGALVTDHLDRDPTNNDPANLVPSCHGCNCYRDHPLKVADDELFIVRGKYRHRAVQRFCNTCGQAFVVIAAEKRPERSRFCSRSCARRAGVLP